jgi:2-polyprenyl-3-methyl-5-hydroxy-6-metoxy-1,4-benzoquinol methylase
MSPNKQLIDANIQQVISEVDTFTLERYNLFVKHIHVPNPTILDFGCNTGRGGIIIQKNLDKVNLIGCDIVSERLEKIPTSTYDKIIDLSKVKLDDSQLPRIDVIVSGEVVEHIPFDELVNYLNLFLKILNANGILMLTTPNPNSLLVKLGRQAVLKDPSHINIMDSRFLKQLILKCGFSKAKILGSGKATRYFGESLPLWVYGSFMIIAYK